MNDEVAAHPPREPRPKCPVCQEPMILVGTITQVGRYKKWVDDWRCATHGAPQPVAPDKPKVTG